MTNETCTLVALKLSAWSASKHDKRASAEVEQNKHAANGSARVYKTLVSKQWLDPINKIDNKIRSEFYRLTLAYPVTSVALLPNAARERFESLMGNLFDQRQERIEAALSAYDAELERARLGELFNESDYPTVSEIRRKYGHKVMTLPMPNAARSGIDDDTLRAQIDDARREGFSEAYQDAWQRVADCARNVADKLKAFKPANGGNKAENVFRDSLIDNARELVDTLESMVEVFGDDKLTAALATLKADIAKTAPETLRGNERVRAEVTNTAMAILDTALAQMDAGYSEPSQPAPVEPMPVPAAPVPAPVPPKPAGGELDIDALLD